MRGLREQPRWLPPSGPSAIARCSAPAIASEDPEGSPDLPARPERSEQLRRDKASELQRLAAQVARLRADLETATRRARDRTRMTERLRRERRAARRNPVREAQ